MLVIFLVLTALLCRFSNPQDCSLPIHEELGFALEANVLLGGLIPVHLSGQYPDMSFVDSPKPILCHAFGVSTYRLAQAMIFAIDEINRNQTFLPNTTLGFLIYDTCLSSKQALQGTLWMLTRQNKPILNYGCHQGSPLVAVIGESRSTTSISMARVLGLYRVPQLLHYMKRVRFTNKMGEEMSFDSQGDPPSRYDIINWKVEPDGAMQYVKAGRFNSRATDGQELQVNISAILWKAKYKEVPRSVCSESCVPGYRKAAQKGQPACCFDCVPCAEGEISNETDSTDCWKCPHEHWPNDRRTECVPKMIEFLSYQEPLGATLTGAVNLCSFTSIIMLCIFLKYRDTPIVKANNRELTYLLLGGLVLSFLCSFFFIGVPQPMTCLLRQPAFGIIFALCVSCVLAKTIMVVIAFNATKPGSNMRRWLGPQVPVVTVSGCTGLQVLICTTWLLHCPPFTEKNMKLKTGTIIFQCNECSETAFWCMLGYMGLLACVSFLVAFLARKLPDSFNEAKWITFSMLVFLSVWLSFVPGYLSTQGKYMVAVEVFGIISSSAGLLTCMFLPKCYIILLRPDRNTREHLLGKGTKKSRR